MWLLHRAFPISTQHCSKVSKNPCCNEAQDVDPFYSVSSILDRSVRLDWRILPTSSEILRALPGLLTPTDAQGVSLKETALIMLKETALKRFDIDEQIRPGLLAMTWILVFFRFASNIITMNFTKFQKLSTNFKTIDAMKKIAHHDLFCVAHFTGKDWNLVGYLMAISTSYFFFYHIKSSTEGTQHLLEGS